MIVSYHDKKPVWITVLQLVLVGIWTMSRSLYSMLLSSDLKTNMYKENETTLKVKKKRTG